MEERPSGAIRRAPVATSDVWDEEELNRFRELRAEIQGLQFILGSIRKGEAIPKTYAGYFKQTMDNITQLMGDIEDGDAVRLLHNIWNQMKVCPLLVDPGREFSAQEQLHCLNMLEAQCRKIIFEVGVLTIPARVTEWLANARPGYYIPFHSVFDDELPDFEDRVRLLNYLAWSPKVIEGGLVDATNGLIYRYSQSPVKVGGSLLVLVMGLAMAIGVVITAAYYLPLEDWPATAQRVLPFLLGWGAVLVGTLVHAAIGAVKRAQARGGYPPVIALGNLLLVVNAKIGPILLKLFLTLIAFFGVVLTVGGQASQTVGTGGTNVIPVDTALIGYSFLAGYSLDSVVELFGTSIEQQAAAQVATLKKQLGL
jgi:hypothetical protein